MKSYLLLFFSIGFEVLGTSMLKLSDGFTNLVPSVMPGWLSWLSA